MSDPAPEKIKIEWDDLTTRKVDQRLREQEALERNRRQADRVPVADAVVHKGWLRSHPVTAAALFGLLGALLAWGGRQAFRLMPDYRAESILHMRDVEEFTARAANGTISAVDADNAIKALRDEYRDNPYFVVDADPSLSPADRQTRRAAVEKDQASRELVTNLMSFGIAGLLISICLSIAEPVVDGNKSAVVLNGLIGAALGLIGGGAASLVMPRVFDKLAAGTAPGTTLDYHRLLARAVSWGVLGLFLTIGPGIAMRNGKKLGIGLLAGLLGGLAGGAIFEPVYFATEGLDWVSWGVALVCIGVTTGAATGLIEQAAKNGWLKVTAGLIAGKQFILYRNPTFIGSGPECPVYLFKDPKVGRKHAAVHIVPGGFEIENLPMGADTTVNGKPVGKTRLKTGDVIQIGATSFQFNEKQKDN